MAIKAAQEKAMAMTREIGQSIGKAHSITEQGLNFGGAQANNFMGTATRDTSSDDETTIAFGHISITARVVVSFELK